MQELMIPAPPFMLGEGAHYPLHSSVKPGAYQLIPEGNNNVQSRLFPKGTTTCRAGYSRRKQQRAEPVIPEGNNNVQSRLFPKETTAYKSSYLPATCNESSRI